MDSKRRLPLARRLARRWRLWGFFLLAGGTGALTAGAVATPYFSWDPPISRSLQALSLPGLQGLSLLLHYAGRPPGVIAEVLALAAALLILRQRRSAAFVLALLIPNAVNQVVKALIDRPRPDPDLVQVLVDSNTRAFPSGHMVHFTLLIGLMLFLVARSPWRKATKGAAMALLGAVLPIVGASRIYLGAHWASDVLGGFLWGLLYLWVLLEVHRRFEGPAARTKGTEGQVQEESR